MKHFNIKKIYIFLKQEKEEGENVVQDTWCSKPFYLTFPYNTNRFRIATCFWGRILELLNDKFFYSIGNSYRSLVPKISVKYCLLRTKKNRMYLSFVLVLFEEIKSKFLLVEGILLSIKTSFMNHSTQNF